MGAEVRRLWVHCRQESERQEDGDGCVLLQWPALSAPLVLARSRGARSMRCTVIGSVWMCPTLRTSPAVRCWFVHRRGTPLCQGKRASIALQLALRPPCAPPRRRTQCHSAHTVSPHRPASCTSARNLGAPWIERCLGAAPLAPACLRPHSRTVQCAKCAIAPHQGGDLRTRLEYRALV